MTQAVLTDARYVRVWVGLTPTATGAIKLCALDRKALNQTINANTAIIPDCDDPTKVVAVRRTAVSKDVTIAASGYYESANRADLQDIMDAAISVDMSFEIMAPDPNPGWYAGKFLMTTFNTTANNADGYITAEFAFEADGDVTWADATP